VEGKGRKGREEMGREGWIRKGWKGRSGREGTPLKIYKSGPKFKSTSVESESYISLQYKSFVVSV